MNLKELIKTKDQIHDMKIGGHMLAEILNELIEYTKPGLSTKQVDTKFGQLCEQNGVKSAFKDYEGFPGYMCVNINDGVVHGIGSESVIIESEDVVKLDVGLIYKGLNLDMSETVYFGSDPKIEAFVRKVVESRDKGISNVKQGNTVGDISSGIQQVIERAGYSVVRELVGHGIGKHLHEAPDIPGYVTVSGKNFTLLSGMTIAIEAIINMGKGDIVQMPDGWLFKTRDGKVSAIAEHTILVTDKGYEVLTI